MRDRRHGEKSRFGQDEIMTLTIDRVSGRYTDFSIAFLGSDFKPERDPPVVQRAVMQPADRPLVIV